MIYLKNAELHRDLYQESLATHLDHLKKLSSTQGKSRSRFVDLYLGETLIESGNTEPALIYLERFAADDSVGPHYRNVARVSIGLCFALQNNSPKADEAWNSADTGNPEVKTALAAAYSKAGLKDKKPVALAHEGLADLKRSGTAPSLRVLKNVITVYATAGLADEGLELLRKADLKSFSYKESLGKTKIITFYDVSLLGDLSTLYLQAAISALEKAAEDGKLRETANFYLGEAYALGGNIDRSMKATASFIASSSMPQQYRDKAAARRPRTSTRKAASSTPSAPGTSSRRNSRRTPTCSRKYSFPAQGCGPVAPKSHKWPRRRSRPERENGSPT
jgi:tetratricopeptide (TPR) repeat protein